MENSAFKQIFLVVALLFGAVYVSFDVLAGQANELGRFALYFLIFSLLISLVSPKVGIYWVLLISGYVDLFKRLLVLSGNVWDIHLYYVLGTPPVAVCGAVVATIFAGAIGKVEIPARAYWGFVVACGFSAIMAAFSLKSGSGVGGLLKSTADTATYSFFLFLIPVYFRGVDEMLKLVRTVLWFYVPMAIYVLWQFQFGYTDFEREYLESGYTVTGALLYDAVDRPFSTLNSPHAAGVMCSMLFFLSASLIRLKRAENSTFLSGVVVPFGMACLYFSAAFATLTRACHVVWLFGFVALIFFQSPARVTTIYAVMVGAFLLLVFNAGFLLDRVSAAEAYIQANGSGSDVQEMLTRVGTYSDRLVGFERMVTSDKMWTWFGNPDDVEAYGEVYSHDLLGGMLINYGVIFTGGMVLLAFFGAFVVHRASFRVSGEAKQVLITFYAVVVGLVVLSALAGSALSVFPVNQILWMLTALSVILVGEARALQEGEQEPEEDAPVQGAAPSFVGQRHPLMRGGMNQRSHL